MHQQILLRSAQVVRSGIEQGLHLGVQGLISLKNEHCSLAFGHNSPAEPLTSEHLMLWLSSGKPLTAAAILQLADSGEFSIQDPVSKIIPEFAQGQKQEITLHHLLTHSAGLKPILTGWPHKPWDEIIQKICSSSRQRDWNPKTQGAYDPARSWFILGEVIRRVTGEPVEVYLRKELLLPLGMNHSWLAMPADVHASQPIGIMYALNNGELTPTAGHTADACTHPSPGGSMRGPIAELGLFYKMLLNDGVSSSGHTILKEATVHQMIHRHRTAIRDETFQHVIDFGLGVIINSNRYGAETVPYGFGRHSSDSAFGHGGAQSSIGFADPEHDLVVTLVANGCPGEELHQHRFRELISAIYLDLELV
jgi:CubicO group peptidase (beta-lactamase class C family)